MIKEEYKRNIKVSTGVGCGELCTLYRVLVVRQVSAGVGCAASPVVEGGHHARGA